MCAILGVMLALTGVMGNSASSDAASARSSDSDVRDTGGPADYGFTVVATWPDERLGVLTFTHDDDRADHYNIAGPALTARGLKGTFYVNPGFAQWATQRPRYAQLAAQGHELGSHTMLHLNCVIKPAEQDPQNLYFHSLDELAQDCVTIKSVLDPLQSGRPTLSFAYPYGNFETQTRQLLAPYFLSCRRSVEGLHVNPPTPPDPTLLMPSIVGSSSGSAWADYGYTYTMLSSYLQGAITGGGWVVEEYHDIAWPGYDGVDLQGYYDHLDDVAEAVANGQLWVAPAGDVMRYIKSRNAATVALVSSSNGEIALDANDALDDFVYDVPVTLRTRIPLAWAPTVRVTVNGQQIPRHVNIAGGDAFVRYSVRLTGVTVSITGTPLQGYKPAPGPVPQPNIHP